MLLAERGLCLEFEAGKSFRSDQSAIDGNGEEPASALTAHRASSVSFHLAQDKFLKKAVKVDLKQTQIAPTAQRRAIMVAQFVIAKLIGGGDCPPRPGPRAQPHL